MIKKYLSLYTAVVCIIAQSCNTNRHGNCMDNQPLDTGSIPIGNDVSVTPISIYERRAGHNYANFTNFWCFSSIFGKVWLESGNQNEFTMDLLNSLLELSGDNLIKEVHLSDSILSSRKKSGPSLYMVDVYCIDNKDNRFIVKMGVFYHSAWVEQLQDYISSEYNSQLHKEKENYKDLSPVYSLAIVIRDMFPMHKKYLSHYECVEGKFEEYFPQKKSFSRNGHLTVVELDKFNKTISEISNQKDRWIFLFRNSKLMSNMSEEEKYPLTSNRVIRNVCTQIDQFNWTELEAKKYERSEDNRKLEIDIFETAHLEGMIKGLVKHVHDKDKIKEILRERGYKSSNYLDSTINEALEKHKAKKARNV